jgi:hypothetical protein
MRHIMVVAALLLAPSTALAAEAKTIGPGGQPNATVDATGTAYIAFNGPDAGAGSKLRFCRLPRGATACDAGVSGTIASPGTSLSRPFVTVSGDRVVVVQHRYGVDVPGFSQLYRFTSNDRGAQFDGGAVVGKLAFSEAVPGPGDTMSGVTDADACGMCFQNVVQSGAAPVDLEGRTLVPHAVLSSTRPYGGAVGMLDAGTPLAVFADGSGAQQFRRYSGSGSLNSEASWTAPVNVANPLGYPKLAGGPAGLFMLGNVGRDVFVRKFDGVNFGPSVQIGGALGVSQHLFQDPGGRLHAVWHRFGPASIELVHAVSDDGVGWTSGVAVTQPGVNDFVAPRIAAAADHVGVAVWGANEGVRVAPLGPSAPAAPAPAPTVTAAPTPAPTVTAAPKAKPDLTVRGSAKRKGRKVRFRISGRLVLPSGVTPAAGCSGNVRVTLLRGKTRLVRKTVTVGAGCRFALSGKVKRSKVGRASRLRLRLSFTGNAALGPRIKEGLIRVRRASAQRRRKVTAGPSDMPSKR